MSLKNFAIRSACAAAAVAVCGSGVIAAAADRAGLVVEYRCPDAASANQIRAHVRIANHLEQAVPLRELTLRYWYKAGGDKPQKFWCDYAKVGAENVTAAFHKLRNPTAAADTYLEIGFKEAAASIEPGGDSGEIQIRVANEDWSNFDQQGDYSFDALKRDFSESPHVTLYRNGKRVWGTEPGGDGVQLLAAAAADVGGTPAIPDQPRSPPWPPKGGVPTSKNVYLNRFLTLWGDLHNPANSYFSPEGVPYHAIETLIVEAPDQGHETTSEAFSYWLWLEAAYGAATGDWAPLEHAWQTTEQYAIPGSRDQPTSAAYNPSHPATYAAEHPTPDDYPSPLDSSIPVGRDPIADELKAAYGTANIYAMHWLLDADNWYGYGRRGDGVGKPTFINTFQRGPEESVWKTVPHPSWEAFRWGGRNGFLDLFTGDNNYSRQWRYTDAPDADARAVQAIYWAHVWAAKQGHAGAVPAKQAARMGDCLRYSFFDKYFKKLGCRSPREQGGSGYQSAHYLISWYYAWGGSADPGAGWAWRIGCSHVHFGYQNPLTAWVLSTQPDFAPASPHAARDWAASLTRQLEFYRWLQSAEGAIAGGATNSWNGSYDRPPAGTPTFYGMAYDWQPVYHDPPSNNWFGMQVWSMERVAEYYYASGDARARAILDRWVAWARANTKLTFDGGYAIPSTLHWTGQPDTWDPDNPGGNLGLHASVVKSDQDVGVAASLAKTLIFYSAGTKRWATQDTASLALARELLDRMWKLYRDDRGLSVPEPREDYKRFFEQKVYIPSGWTGKMANGDAIRSGVTFLDIRSKYRSDPDFAKVERAYRGGVAPAFRYHRFWAQCEVATANAIAAVIGSLER
jgi:hypothetical protein